MSAMCQQLISSCAALPYSHQPDSAALENVPCCAFADYGWNVEDLDDDEEEDDDEDGWGVTTDIPLSNEQETRKERVSLLSSMNLNPCFLQSSRGMYTSLVSLFLISA